MKAMLAHDYDPEKLRFPLIHQPKIDGVRGININGVFTGRSLKRHKNVYTSNIFSGQMFRNLDGELAAERETHPDLCRLTTSAVNTISGKPFVCWWLFDYFESPQGDMPYQARYQGLVHYYRYLQTFANTNPEVLRLRLVPMGIARDLQELDDADAEYLDKGFEGTIIRDMHGMHKSGRSTINEMGLLRIKRFVEEDAIVNSVVQGQYNGNEATINELGRTSRSTHQANMYPNGLLGAMLCTDIKTGKPITVSAGSMDHDQRKLYYEKQTLIVGKRIKYKCFPKGVKDLPRFPTFQYIVEDSDIVQ